MPSLKEYATSGKTVTPEEFSSLMKDRAQYFHDKHIDPSDLSLDPNSETTLIHKSLFEEVENHNIQFAVLKQTDQITEQGDEPRSVDEAYYPLQKFAVRQLCTKLGIPVEFFTRCRKIKENGSRLDAHFNTWIGRQGRSKTWFVRFDTFSGKSEVRSILSKRFEDVTNVEVSKYILASLPNKYDYKIRFEWTREALYGQIISEKVTRKLSNGQEIKGGIRFKNSEVGLGSIALEMLVLCDAIQTGPILPGYVGLRRTHLQKKDALKKEFGLAVEDLVGNMENALDLVAATEYIRIRDPQDFIEMVFLRHKLEVGQQEAVRETLQTCELKTMFDAIKIFSLAGTDPGMSVEKREKLQRVSGTLAHGVNKYGAWIIPEKPDAA